MMLDVVVPLLLIVLLVAANAVFVAAEFAVVAARPMRLRALANSGGGSGAKWLLALLQKPTGKDSYVAIAQLGITLASIGLGMYGEPAVAAWLYSPIESLGLPSAAAHAVGFGIALGFITYLHVVFGEMIPKALALQAPERTAVSVNLVMRSFGLLFRPMVWALNRTALGLMHLLGIREPGRAASLYTGKELAIMTGEVAESGQLNQAQRQLINNILELEDRTAGQLMTSRARLRAIAVDTPAEVLSRLVADEPLSRYPVYEGSLDNVLGLLHVKDYIRARVRTDSPDLRRLLRPLPAIAAGASADDLLAMFKRVRVHAARVVDEFGGTLGLVTLDDLISDVIEENAPNDDRIRPLGDRAWSVDGEVTLAELAEDHGLQFEQEDVVTVAGMFLACRGMLPKVSDSVRCAGYTLTVEEMQGLKISRLRISQ
jgi:CBS domain containing-hemolysin-like protein